MCKHQKVLSWNVFVFCFCEIYDYARKTLHIVRIGITASKIPKEINERATNGIKMIRVLNNE